LVVVCGKILAVLADDSRMNGGVSRGMVWNELVGVTVGAIIGFDGEGLGAGEVFRGSAVS
jgi:hypothetical protein